MIGTSLRAYILIRASIVALRAITPLSLIFLGCAQWLPLRRWWPLRALAAWSLAEVAFYSLVYLPRKYVLEQPADYPPLPSAAVRHKIFRRCHETVPNPDSYLVQWFLGSPVEEIKEENVKDFLRWSFFNDAIEHDEHEEEMQLYLKDMEEMLGRPLEKGRGTAVPLRLTTDVIRMRHRPLFWYLLVFFVDQYTHARLLYHGFRYHRTALKPYPQTFPLRPQTLLTTHVSQSQSLSYWYKPHTSQKRLPILFLHGIGIGLVPYIPYLDMLTKNDHEDADGQVGVVVLEIMPISFRITVPALSRTRFLHELKILLESHPEFDHGFVLAAHSYGSVITTWITQYTPISTLVSSIVLIDPVSLLLHLPDVAYNFTYRYPSRANEWQLWYFASTDPDVAHTLGRRFFWNENILWKEDLLRFLAIKPHSRGVHITQSESSASSEKSDGSENLELEGLVESDETTRPRRVSVFLAGRDLIVNTPFVWNYLTGEDVPGPEDAGGVWTSDSGQISVFWAPELDHASIFDSNSRSSRLIQETKRLLWR